MLNKIEKYPIVSIIVIVIAMLCLNLSVFDVSIMEARNFITAREMLTDGNWLLTTMNGEPRYQKPPLPSWLAAISALVFGIKQVFAYRLPGVIMVMLLGIFTYRLSKKLVNDKQHAFVNALILITSFYVTAIIAEAPWDIFTHGFMLIAIVHLFQLFEKKTQYWKHTIIAGIFFGLSILSKGPVSLYVLLLPFLLAYGITYRYKGFRAKVFSLFSFVLIALIVGGWWYLHVRIEDPETFTAITLKETSNWRIYNVRPFYYYWSFFMQSGLWTIPAFISLLYPYMKSRVRNLKAYKLSILWVLFSVLLLSVIPEKKSRYLMPVLIPLAINTGFYIAYLLRHFKSVKNKSERLPISVNFGLIGLIGLAFPFSFFYLKDLLNGTLVYWFIVASVALGVIGFLILINLSRKRLKNVFYLCIGFMVFAMITIPRLSEIFRADNYHPITDLSTRMASEGISLYVISDIAPEMIWQYGKKITPIKRYEDGYVFPQENVFGLLTRNLNETELEIIKKTYYVSFQETFDLNRKAPETSGYRERLYNDFYILTKK